MARKISVEIVGDAASLEKAFGKASHSAGTFEKNIGRAGKGAVGASIGFHGLGRSIGFASAQFLGAAGFVEVVKTSIGAASSLEEQMRRTDVVFRKDAASVKAWSKTSAEAMGMSRSAALDAANTIGTLLKNSGAAPAKIAPMSKSVVQLAADMAAFKKVKPEEALSALEAGLMGRTRSLKQFGIVIDATSLKAEALSSGLLKANVDTGKVADAQTKLAIAQSKQADAVAKYGPASREAAAATLAVHNAQRALEKSMAGATGQLTAQQKSLATYQLIMKQTKDQQGAFGKNSDELAVIQQKLHANLQNVEAEIGRALLPTVEKYSKTLDAWLAKEQKNGDIQRDTKKVVEVLTAAIHAGTDVVKVAEGAFKGLSAAVGGDKHAVELLAGAFIAYKATMQAMAFASMAQKVGLIGGAATTAKGEVNGLRGSLLGLNALTIAPILIPIEIAISKKEHDWLSKHAGILGKAGQILLDIGTGDVAGNPISDVAHAIGIGGGGDGSSSTSSGTVDPEAGAKGAHGKGRAAAGSDAGLAWSGDYGGLDGGFKTKLANCVAAAGGTSIDVTSGRRSASHNAAVGGAHNSNHLTGHAADGTCTINGKTYPLGQAPIDYGSYGLRAGSTFDWGGSPDIYHVDDGSNVGGAGTTPTSTPTSTPTYIPSGKKPKSTVHTIAGSKLLSASDRLRLAHAAGTPGTDDDLAALKQAKTHLEALQRTASKAERVPIAEELAKISKEINRIDAAKLKKKLAEQASVEKAAMRTEETAWKAHLKKLQDAATQARQTFEKTWSRSAESVLKQFDRVTAAAVASMEGDRAGLTPTEQKLKDLQDAHDQAGLDKTLADARAARDAAQVALAAASKGATYTDDPAKVRELADATTDLATAQKDLAAAKTDAEKDARTKTVREAKQKVADLKDALAADRADFIKGQTGDAKQAAADLADAQAALDQAQYDEQVAALQKSADAERTARDKEYADKEQAYQDQREVDRQALQDWLDQQEIALETGKTKWDAFYTALKDKAAIAGIDVGNLFWDGWKQAATDFNTSAAAAGVVAAQPKAIAGIVPAGGRVAKTSGKNTYDVGGIQVTPFARGGIVTRPTVALIGEAGKEAVIPLGSGGLGTPTINLTVNAPNYVGSHQELAAALKHPSVLEAVGAAVTLSSRRGHLRQGDIQP